MPLPHSVKQDRRSTNWAMLVRQFTNLHVHFVDLLFNITVLSKHPSVVDNHRLRTFPCVSCNFLFTQYFTICIEVELLYILIDDVIYTTIPPGCTLLSQWIDYSNAQTLVWNFLQVLELWLCKNLCSNFHPRKTPQVKDQFWFREGLVTNSKSSSSGCLPQCHHGWSC